MLLRTDADAHPRALGADGFYGWRIVALAGFALGATAPGQTIGISVFVDHLIIDLDITRSTLSTAYLVGTLGGAVALPVVGRALDRWGIRLVMTLVAAAFGVALLGASAVVGPVSLMLAFVALRMLGQGSLTLTATTAVAFWFERRRGTAVGISTAAGQGLMSLAPVVLAATIAAIGWRSAWMAAGAVMLVVLVPSVGVLMRDRPADLGQAPDGDHRDRGAAARSSPGWGLSRGEALRTGAFWTVTATVATSAMIGTGVTFHQISLLGDRGFTATEAAAVFVPLTVAGIAATFALGWLADRVRARTVLVIAMLALSGGMVVVQHVTPGPGVLVYAALLGTSAGAVRTIEGAVIPALFGTRHLGAIRGAVMTIMVAATAFGPLALSLGLDHLGGYSSALNLLLVLPVAAITAAAVTSRPEARPRGAIER